MRVGIRSYGPFPPTYLRIPLILLISSPPCGLNRLGLMAAQLVVTRPGKFDGVELVGGSHPDAVQGGNPPVQLGAHLVGGFSQPQTIDAVQRGASMTRADSASSRFLPKLLQPRPTAETGREPIERV